MIRALCLFLCLASCAAAQTAYVERGLVSGCFTNTPIGAIYPQCLGQAAQRCQSAPGGGTTIGITACITAEMQVWDEILNTEYQATQTANAQADQRSQGAGLSRVDALRSAQRAWIAFRDADCAARYAMWQDGSIRGIVGANCQLTKTAQRAIALRDMRGQ